MTAATSRPVRLWLLLAAVAAMAACSGGGGDGGAPGGDPGGNPALGTLRVESSSLTFTAMTTSHSPPYQTVRATVTGVTSKTLYIKVAATGPAISSIANVFVTSTTGGQADVFPGSASALGPGVHTGTIQVWACTSGPDCTSGNLAGSPQTIAVTYTVYGVVTSISSASYAIGNTPAPADSVRELTVKGTPGETWSASSDAGWLSLSSTSGTGDATTPVTASLVPGLVDAMPNGAYTAAISFVPARGQTVRIPVTLSIARTQLDHVAPVIATSGAPADVILRGQNLDQVTAEWLSFGDTAAAAFQVVSSSEIRATHPALAAGSYPVRLQTNLGTAFSLATLVVVDAPSYGAAFLPYPTAAAWYFMDLAYDPQRRALLVGAQEGYDRKLLRYGYTDGVGWSAATVTPFPGLAALAWSADGQRLLVGSGSGITEVDPATLAAVGTTRVNGEYASALAVTNDGEVLVWTHDPRSAGESRFYRCSLRDQTWTSYPEPYLAWVSLGTSGDGSRVVLGGESRYLPQLHRYDASTHAFSSLGQRTYGRTVIAVDRTGSRTLMGSNGTTLSTGTYQVFDADLALLGSLPATSRAAVVHPDGTRAYTYEPSGSEGKLRVFDLTQTIAGAFPELGTAVTLAGNPEAQAYEVKMVISPDGGTIFLAGDDAIVVEPTPRR